MKKLTALFFVGALTFSSHSHAEGFLDSIKSFFGGGDEETAEQAEESLLPTATGLVDSLTSNLGVSQAQAEGGLGSILNYAKGNVSSEQFSQVTGAIPGLEGLLGAVPDISNIEQSEVGGLLSKAAEYSDSLQAVNTLKQQFDALGIDSGMIMQYVQQAQQYLDTPQGQSAKEMLTQAFSSFGG
ncbi:MAG: DUF2780 domain-containing protein [Pseudomonadota bacterium]